MRGKTKFFFETPKQVGFLILRVLYIFPKMVYIDYLVLCSVSENKKQTPMVLFDRIINQYSYFLGNFFSHLYSEIN